MVIESNSASHLYETADLARISRSGNRSIGTITRKAANTSSNQGPPAIRYQFLAARANAQATPQIQEEINPVENDSLPRADQTQVLFPWVDVSIKTLSTIDKDRYTSASGSSKFYESTHSAEVQFYDAKLKKSKKVNVSTYGVPSRPLWASYHE